jgi:PEP-CTERM motif
MPRCHILGCICTIAIALFSSTARAGIIINFAQVGNDVIATGSGTANTAALNLVFSLPSSQVNLDASSGNFRGGSSGVPFSVFNSITGPGNFGLGTGNFPSSSSGDYFGLTAFNNRLFLPGGYVSGTQLSNSTTWNNRTIANLGLAPVGSTFTYTWGSGVDADSLTINITAVPEPSSVLCLTLGLSCVALFRRKKLSNPLVG